MSYDPSPSYPPPSYPYRPPDPPASYDPYTYETYPWAPREAPEPAERRPQRHAALGHHSDLRVLRSAYRWQRRVATLTALGYFVLFLILSAFAPSFMTSTVTDGLPTGLLLALVQVPVTWLAVALYEQTARRRVDPIADRIRKHAELDAKREGAR
ncbi:hypothetical protein GCM10010103_36370 [Streptomyces paradoxus]|uniref:Uncharacterized membrane protein (DUF485 family) n=1 Tax=Streptomyces paradoxus TaxID=66375 RepID=A0A7W9TCD1_9ACTN|nr:DUF485 domain-containing protein [Streptomyces paradoxus]MBB6078104.1 uncharacterized membrane protein (DUF485 family) [Streptomyces paradoxus]